MALLERQSLQQIRDRIRADIRARLPNAHPELRRSLLGILADIQAAYEHGDHGYIEWLAHQVVPDRSRGEKLRDWLDFFDVSYDAVGAPARGEVEFAGEDDAEVPAGTRLAADDGTEYDTDEAALIADGQAVVAVTATEPGAGGGQSAGETLSLVQSVPGVDGEATVTEAEITAGTDPDTEEQMQSRLRRRMRRQPGTGNDDWYAERMLEVAGVTRAWIFRHHLGAGTVGGYLAADDADAGPIPAQALVDEVQEHVDELRPTTATFYSIPPIADPIDFEIGLTPDTSATRAAVEESLDRTLERDAKPGATTSLNRLRTAIALAAGIEDYTLLAPSADIPHDTGHLAVRGEMTWSS